MPRLIKLQFTDFWPAFQVNDNYFTQLLRKRFDIEISPDPDFLIYSCFGNAHLKYGCTRIFYSGENRRPDFRFCDYALTFDYLSHPRHYRLPNYVRRDYHSIRKPADPRRILAEKTHFCNFVYSNSRCRKRNRFFEKLSRYKRVDSGGRHFNNIGGPVEDKLSFLRKYKFTIAFENASHPGYTTEKIVEPMVVNSLPIYWGNPLVHLDFNPRSFINYYDHGNDEALIDHIIAVDKNDELYLQYLSQPYLHNDQPDPRFHPDAVLSEFERIFARKKPPVAQLRKHLYYWDRVTSRITKNAGRIVDQLTRLARQE